MGLCRINTKLKVPNTNPKVPSTNPKVPSTNPKVPSTNTVRTLDEPSLQVLVTLVFGHSLQVYNRAILRKGSRKVPGRARAPCGEERNTIDSEKLEYGCRPIYALFLMFFVYGFRGRSWDQLLY